MVNRAVKFTQADIARIYRAAKSAGEVVRIEIHPDGRITATPVLKREAGASVNEWDSIK
jgi:hypothetical protein